MSRSATAAAKLTSTTAVLVFGALACTAVLVAFDIPLFRGEVYLGHDLGLFHLPMRWFYQRSIIAGEPFDWFPHWFNGIYLQGEGQGGFYHPLNWLLYRSLPLDVAFNLELLRSYLALVIGSYFFLRRWSLAREAALLGGLVAALSGASLHHYFMLNVMAGIAHLPLLLLAIDVAAREQRPARAATGAIWLALLTGSQLLLGHPQMIYASGVVEGLYLLLMLWSGCGWRRLGRIALAITLGLSIGGVQLLPMLDSVQHSIRDTALAGPGSAVAFDPLDVSQLAAPYLFARGAIASGAFGALGFRADLSLYASALAPVLLVWLLSQRGTPRETRPLLIWTVIVALLCFVLATGHAGRLYRLQLALPLVGQFRTPARYGLVVDIALGFMMAIALDALLRRRAGRPITGPPRRLAWLWLAPLLSAGLVGVFHAGWLNAPKLSSTAWLASGPALVLVATLLVVLAARGSRAALVAIMLFTSADLALYGLRYLHTQPRDSIERFLAGIGRPDDYSFEHRVLSGHTAMVMKDMRMTTGLVAMVPKQFSVLAMGREDPNRRAFLRISSVAWPSARTHSTELEPLPRARLLSDSRVSHDPLHELASIDVASTALVGQPLDLAAGPPGSARIVAESPGRIQLQVEAPTRQLLVISESHHEGWRARSEAGSCDVIAVYGYFLGCVVEAGRHELRFEFSPTSLRRGRGLSLAGSGGVLLWIAWEWARRRRGRRPAAAEPDAG